MSVEVKARLLDSIQGESLGVRELARRLHIRPQTIISLIQRMEGEGLIVTYREKNRRRGRPKKTLKPTALGLDYLDAFRRLQMKPLRASGADLDKAKRDADYANRLIARGKHPYSVFMELFDLVRTGRYDT